jgi:hypothetical protein
LAPKVATSPTPATVDPGRWAWHRKHSRFPRRTPADPAAIIEHYYLAADAKPRKPKETGRGWSWGGGSAWTAAIIATHLLLALRTSTTNLPAITAQLIAAGLAMATLRALTKNHPTAQPIQIVSLTALALLGPEFYWYAVPTLTLTLIGITSSHDLLRAHLDRREARRGITYPMPSMAFGAPGGVTKSAGLYGKAAVTAGARGETATAKILDLLLEIPGTTVLHGLKFPGSANADVDHAIVNGRVVILVDSKQFRAGQYAWAEGEGTVIENTKTGTRYANHMASARRGYRSILGSRAEVYAIVLMHGKNATVGPNNTADGVLLATAQEAMAAMGRIVDQEFTSTRGHVDNSRIVGRMLLHMKR